MCLTDSRLESGQTFYFIFYFLFLFIYIYTLAGVYLGRENYRNQRIKYPHTKIVEK